MTVKQNALEIGRLAERLARGYYSYTAAIEVARDPRAKALVSTTSHNQPVPVSYVTRKDGTRHVFDFHHYLDQAHADQEIIDDLARSWLVGSLLIVGDALSKREYFDHAPELELLYHLRNGIAHGNAFHFTTGGLERLAEYPAHNRLALVRSDTKAEFEIVPSLRGQPVLFEFMWPGDVLDLLQSVGLYFALKYRP